MHTAYTMDTRNGIRNSTERQAPNIESKTHATLIWNFNRADPYRIMISGTTTSLVLKLNVSVGRPPVQSE